MREEKKSGFLTLFQIANELRRGKNIEYILSELKLLDINPYFLSSQSLHDFMLNKYLANEKDSKFLFKIISMGAIINPSNLVKLLPYLILAIQKKKKIENDIKNNLNTSISKITVIITLLSVALSMIIYFDSRFLSNSPVLRQIYGTNVTMEYQLTLIPLLDVFISVVTGTLAIIALFQSLKKENILPKLLVRWSLALLVPVALYMMMILT